MIQVIILAIFLFSATSVWGQSISAADWAEQAKTNIRLRPKYGHIPKTEEQKKLDESFINETMKQESFKGDRTAASNHLITLGFSYLSRGDAKTAMYRFNQAYLLDSLNTDIYWGYGAVYMSLGNQEEAVQQYQEGLSQNPNNTHLLTDLGTYYLGQYYLLKSKHKEIATTNLDTAISYMLKSYELDNKDQNTTFKLSVCYWNKSDCDNAWRYYNECKALGGQPINDAYTNDLKKSCKPKK